MEDIKIKTEEIPEELMEQACKILNNSVREYLSTHQDEFKEWKKQHEGHTLSSLPRPA